jgi:hypothetical protein
MTAVGPERLLSPEELAALLDDRAGRPLPAVLDTACVRTGLHYQLSNGTPPASVTTARDGKIRLFMEFDTLTETLARLPKFAAQFGVTVADLRRMLAEDWLPHIQVVKLPPPLRQLDPRATAVRDKDADDYPAAALAALLSPCILLTHNHKDFTTLGVRTSKQGIDAVMAVIAVDIGELHLQAVLMVPTAPVQLAVAGGKWAAKKIGPTATWVILIAAAAAGIYWYCKQPAERRERIKDATWSIAASYMNELTTGTEAVTQARLDLRALLVPRPGQRTRASAILRELAVAPESLSAQQLTDLLDAPPRVTDLRAFLRANDAIFRQVRRGGYELGLRYQLPDVTF